VKIVRASTPVYDLHTFSPGRVHPDICAGPFADYHNICEKLVIPHQYDFYQIVLIVSGDGKKIIDLEQFDIVPGRLYFVAPGQVHSWNFSGRPDGYAINFTEKIFRSYISSQFYLEQFPFLRGIAKNCLFDPDKETLKDIKHFIKRIVSEVKKKDTFSTDIICFNLISLFISISRNNPLSLNKQIPGQKQLVLYNFRSLVDQHYIQKRLPKEYAAMLHMTPVQLNAICKDLTGSAAGSIIRDKILLEAKRLLVSTDINISEIAYRLNFSDNSYFTKFFKKYTGLTPEEFRK
jgi:AraC family transcriptional activator of pobA